MKQYSFYAVDLLIDGVAIDGFADGNSIITAGRTMPQHGRVMDARGKAVVVSSADKSGIISFELLQTSDQNALLQTRALTSHEAATSGSVDTFIPIQAMLTDKMGNTLVAGVNGFITVQPAIVRGTGIATVSWTIEFEQLWITTGRTLDTGI